jgi:DNA-binding CsgD family transcriptional regulator/GTPase SAR1 family protein
MELLERDRYLTELENAFENLSGGSGYVVLISGEAGIGKTSLVEKFTKNLEDKANILWGACDDLFTPRPLGPLYDIAAQTKTDLSNLLNRQSSRAEIFSTFLTELQQSGLPNIIVIEDVHWADESTFDLIKYLGRRAGRTNSLFIITYRDDEINSSHPLRLVLGDIPAKDLLRIKLPPLTEETVKKLAKSSGIKDLYKITGGNPFLLSELLVNGDEIVPSTIKDSVLTRISRLSYAARSIAELVSIIPTRAERWLIDEIIPDIYKALEECVNTSVLRFEDSSVSFKHELSRIVVEESLSESKRQFLNEKVLQLLLKQDKAENYYARIIHHAAKANNKEVIINYAPDAAKQASLLGAHTLAANHYYNVLKFADEVPAGKLLGLYEGRSSECFLTGQIQEAIKAAEAVIRILRQYPDPEREGEIYRRLSRILWYDCQDEKGEEALNKAIEILEMLPLSRQLAMAYSNKSQTYSIREEYDNTLSWGNKALALASRLNDLEIEAHALNNIGCGKMSTGEKSGETALLKSLEISLKNNFFEQATRAYVNLGSIHLQQRNLYEADKYFSKGLEYGNEKDIYVFSLCMAGHYAKTKLHSGSWDESIELANYVLKQKNAPPGNTVMPLNVLAIIRARRNDPGALKLINECMEMAINMGEVEKIVSIVAAKAEYLWLQNKLLDFANELFLIHMKVLKSDNPWSIGEIAYWLWKANHLSEIPERIAEPYLLQIKDEWKAAAKLWEDLNCPYERALALSEGDEKSMIDAIEIFDRLGASATSQYIKQKMRESGIKSIPKGARKTTRENIAGLTNRQLEILSLLNKGLSNIEIGNQLYISPKTVDHHISAILSKLNIHSRHEAAVFARSNDIS